MSVKLFKNRWKKEIPSFENELISKSINLFSNNISMLKILVDSVYAYTKFNYNNLANFYTLSGQFPNEYFSNFKRILQNLKEIKSIKQIIFNNYVTNDSLDSGKKMIQILEKDVKFIEVLMLIKLMDLTIRKKCNKDCIYNGLFFFNDKSTFYKIFKKVNNERNLSFIKQVIKQVKLSTFRGNNLNFETESKNLIISKDKFIKVDITLTTKAKKCLLFRKEIQFFLENETFYIFKQKPPNLFHLVKNKRINLLQPSPQNLLTIIKQTFVNNDTLSFCFRINENKRDIVSLSSIKCRSNDVSIQLPFEITKIFVLGKQYLKFSQNFSINVNWKSSKKWFSLKELIVNDVKDFNKHVKNNNCVNFY